MKKAQGISINVIIIAAIALLVLVVLSVIYIGRMGDWGTKAADCDNKGGECYSITDTQTCASASGGKYPTKFTGFKCSGTQTCCINISVGQN